MFSSCWIIRASLYCSYKSFIRHLICNIFPQAVAFNCIFCTLEFFNFHEVKVMGHAFGCISNTFHLIQHPKDFLPIYIGVFIVLCFTLRSIIYCEINFVYTARYGLEFFLFSIWISNYCSIICWKDCLFSTEFPLYLCWKSVVLICVGLFLDSVFYFIDQSVYLDANNSVLVTIALYTNTWNQVVFVLYSSF